MLASLPLVLFSGCVFQLAVASPLLEYKLLPNITCLENPPNDVWCDPQRSGVFYQGLLDAVMEKMQLWEPPSTDLKKRLIAHCIGRAPFPALRRRAVYDYHVCTKRIRLTETYSGEGERQFMSFLPRDDQDKIAECNVLPYLIDFALKGNDSGVALDIGAGDSGDCAFPLLSRSHSVHMFETGYSPEGAELPHEHERGFVQMTLDANPGWSDRAVMHGAAESATQMESVFRDVLRIHLIKIDVDDLPSYTTVLKAVEPLLPRVDVVQMELLSNEIGRKMKVKFLQIFQRLGFGMYGIEDVETFPGEVHSSLGECGGDDALLRSRSHREEVLDGRVDYVYGEGSPEHLRLVPICVCPKHVGRQSDYSGESLAWKDPLGCTTQFAFVRQGSIAAETIARQYGDCITVCEAALPTPTTASPAEL
eukprot:TRINITY_DN4890_c0_g1_i2.p1 TRINITY_DN4890_c0_g1~~TRINITY_DN4890_c0_g1_i2.p1  ORF type:complete len:421 (-),score=49.67 TRINITY_DN4890_c0_g1_i2:58-1320(-)